MIWRNLIGLNNRTQEAVWQYCVNDAVLLLCRSETVPTGRQAALYYGFK
jgi:hypothetical protein